MGKIRGERWVAQLVQPILHRRNRRDVPHVANIDPGKASLGRPGFREDAGFHDIRSLGARFWTNRIGCRKMYSMSGARCNDRLMFTFVAFAASCRIGCDPPECVQRGSSTGVAAGENRTCPGIPAFRKALRSFAGYRCHLTVTSLPPKRPKAGRHTGICGMFRIWMEHGHPLDLLGLQQDRTSIVVPGAKVMPSGCAPTLDSTVSPIKLKIDMIHLFARNE